MQFAREVLELMPAFPGREFKMAEIVRYVAAGRTADARKKRAMRKAVQRVLAHLQECNYVSVRLPARRGGSATYRWSGWEK